MILDRSTLITLGSALPPAIGIFGRLETLLKQADADLDGIVELVRVDPALTFQIIRLGNSILYGLRPPCDSLEAAVARVGFRDIHSLVGMIAARQACQADLSAYQVSARQFWENAVGTGLVMAALANHNGMDMRAAYGMGLLRNLGRIILNNHAGAVRYPGPRSAALAHWEQSTYGLPAAEVGAMLLEHWRFSPGIVVAVRSHGEPELVTEPVTAAMLHLAAGVAADWGCGFPGEENCWRRDQAMLERASVTEDGLAHAIAEAQEQYRMATELKWEEAA